MQTIIVDGIKYNEGDYIIGTIPASSYSSVKGDPSIIEPQEVYGKLHIGNNGDIYLCQNEIDGQDCEEENKFGYNYSWVISLNSDGSIRSSDCISIKHDGPTTPTEEVPSHQWKLDDVVIFNDDDDLMPENWVCEETLPIDI